MKSISTTFSNTLFDHTENRKDISLLLEKTKTFLEKKDLNNYYPIILKKLVKRLEIKKDFETARIVSAFDLDSTTTSKLLEKYASESSQYTVTVNKSLLAGFVLTQRGVVMDASVKTLLRKFTQK